LIDEFGWGRVVTGGVVSVFWIGAPLVPFLAMLAEKYGCRIVLLLGVLLEGICLIFIAYISALWELYLLRALMGVGKVMVAVTLPIMVSYWFSKRFGFAIGIVLAGVHLGGVIWPPATQFLIDIIGWRSTALCLAGIMLIVTLPLILIFLRVSKPEEIGLLKDGAQVVPESSPEDEKSEPQTSNANSGLLLGEAIRTGNFWKIIIVTITFYLAYVGILVHEVPYISGIGFSSQFAANLMSLSEFMALTAMLIFGALLDRYNPKTILVTTIFLLLFSVALLSSTAYTASNVLIYMFALIFGIAMGGGDVMWVVALRYYFGQKHYERIYGVWYFVSLTTMFSAPIIVGAWYDLTQSYLMAFLFILAVTSVGFILIATISPPVMTHRNSKIN